MRFVRTPRATDSRAPSAAGSDCSNAEFARLAHQLSIAAERFNQAAREKHASVVFIGSYSTITPQDRTEFIEQIEAEHEAYEVIQELHDKMVRLLSEEPQARAATTKMQ